MWTCLLLKQGQPGFIIVLTTKITSSSLLLHDVPARFPLPSSSEGKGNLAKTSWKSKLELVDCEIFAVEL